MVEQTTEQQALADDEHEVVLVLKQLVVVPSLKGAGSRTDVALWDDIRASEEFPAHDGSAYHILTLRKSVKSEDDVEAVAGELRSALSELRRVWQFAGGARMVTDEARVERSRLYESNADKVKDKLLKAKGSQVVGASMRVFIESAAGYSRMPLQYAADLCARARVDSRLWQLFDYYDKVWNDPGSWFVHLYKVREVLEAIAGSEAATRRLLGISDAEWGRFGLVLNNYDLRHTPGTRRSPGTATSGYDPNEVKQLGAKWIRDYLRTLAFAAA